MAQGSAVMLLGLMALLIRRLAGIDAPIDTGGVVFGALYRVSLLEAHDHLQNLASGSLAASQWRHATARACPHSRQNLRPGLFSVPQTVQVLG